MDPASDPLNVPLPLSPAAVMNEYRVLTCQEGLGRTGSGKTPSLLIPQTLRKAQSPVTPSSGLKTLKTQPSDSPGSCAFADALAKVRSTERQGRQTSVQAIEHWEDLECIRFLNEYYDQGRMDERGYKILYRMCQMIWAIGYEVEIRKKVKLPRAERLAKLKHYCECVLKGVRLFMSNMKARSWRVWTLATSIPQLQGIAWQDVEPKMYRWTEEMSKFHYPSIMDYQLFRLILDHYIVTFGVLLALHRDKPDYGLTREVFPTASILYGKLTKLPAVALEADEIRLEYEAYFWRAVTWCQEDRLWQAQQVARFNALSPEKKQGLFDQWMRCRHKDFINAVNSRASSNPVPPAELDEQMRIFRRDFLRRVTEIIKYDNFGARPKLDSVDLAQRLQLLQEERDNREAVKGWIEALNLDPGWLDEDELSDDYTATVANAEETVFGRSIPDEQQPGASKLEEQPNRYSSMVGETPTSQPDQRWPRAEGLWSGTASDHDSPNVSDESHLEVAKASIQDQFHLSDGPCPHEKAHSTTTHSPSHTKPPSDKPMPRSKHVKNKNILGTLPPPISDSFAHVEEDIADRGHHRASTAPDNCFTTADVGGSDLSRPAASFNGRAIGIHRHGMHIPRVFTGSFSQLETDIRSMQLHKVKTPEDQPDLAQDYDLKVRDFAVTPQISPSPTPSPATLLFRREALLSKETEVQNRVINGELVRTRRPSTKTRAHTIDETNGGLEAWWANDKALPLPRPERKNTI